MSDGEDPQHFHQAKVYMVTERQHRMLQLMESNGLDDEERIRVLGDMVKQSAAWGYLKKWLIQTGAVIGAGGALWGLVELIRNIRA